MQFKKILKSKKGAEATEMLFSCVVILCVVMVVIYIAIYLSIAYNVNYACHRVVRSIEVTGVVDSTSYDLAKKLSNDPNANMTVNATYYDAGAGKIQLRDTFTVTIKTSYSIPIFIPMLNKTPVSVKIPIVKTVMGMSEVYWK